MADGLPGLSQPARNGRRRATPEPAWHQNNLDKARESWQQAFARVEGLRKLVQRYIDEARALEDKREQKLLDELSQRLPRQSQF